MPASPDEKPHFLRKRYTLARVAQLLDVSESTVRRWVEEGDLQPVRITKRGLRFEEDEVERLYQSRKTRTSRVARG